MADITPAVVRDYLNDALPAATAAAVEKAIRDRPDLQALVQQVRQESDRGEHTIGAIWRRERLSCPTREQLAGHLQDILDADLAGYVGFHLGEIGCPFCQANLDDLARLQGEAAETRTQRRKRIVDSSGGLLRDAVGERGASAP